MWLLNQYMVKDWAKTISLQVCAWLVGRKTTVRDGTASFQTGKVVGYFQYLSFWRCQKTLNLLVCYFMWHKAHCHNKRHLAASPNSGKTNVVIMLINGGHEILRATSISSTPKSLHGTSNPMRVYLGWTSEGKVHQFFLTIRKTFFFFCLKNLVWQEECWYLTESCIEQWLNNKHLTSPVLVYQS